MNQSLGHFIDPHNRHNLTFLRAGVPDHAAPRKTFSSPYSFTETACGHHLQIRSKTKGKAELHHLSITKGQFASRAKAADAKRKSRWDIPLPLVWYWQKKINSHIESIFFLDWSKDLSRWGTSVLSLLSLWLHWWLCTGWQCNYCINSISGCKGFTLEIPACMSTSLVGGRGGGGQPQWYILNEHWGT